MIAFGPLLCSLAITAAFVALMAVLVSKADAYREDEAQFPDTGDVR